MDKFLLHELVRKDKRSMQQIADAAGISYRTMSQWFYDGRMPPVDKYVTIIETLGYSIKVEKNETNQV